MNMSEFRWRAKMASAHKEHLGVLLTNSWNILNQDLMQQRRLFSMLGGMGCDPPVDAVKASPAGAEATPLECGRIDTKGV